MRGIISNENGKLIKRYDDEIIWIEAFGKDSLRVRITKMSHMPERDWALIKENNNCLADIEIKKDITTIKNGKMKCIIDKNGFLSFYNEKNTLLLSERWQTREDEENHMSLMYFGRDMKPILGGLYKSTITFEADDNEKIYGMGQRQIEYLDMKGCELELSQRNSQASIPFILSNKGYGFLWNNPAFGRATFAKNLTQWVADVTPVVDYWITAGDSPKDILENYTNVVGRSPNLPEWAAGFWQCKLRYRTQEELLNVAREYKKRGLPMSVIVVDFFHWTEQGDWKFDPEFWPNPKAMVDELKEMGIVLMVSIWPTVDPRSENYAEMKERGLLVRVDRGVRTQQVCLGAEVYFDATNPEAREFIWQKAKDNYLKYGVRMFWLDEAEPEYSHYDFDNYRYHLGTNLECGSIYPNMYAKSFYDGMVKEGITDVVNLIRCAWVGAQKYGVVLWSGDIHSNFQTLRMQVAAGLNAGISGIAWWTTDIGGFFGGDPNDDKFKDLIVRWFQYGLFCPIFRLHGYRLPTGQKNEKIDTGLFDFNTCGANEIWQFGEKQYEIISKILYMREKMKPYIMKIMDEASENGTPPMKPLFFDFYDDEMAWNVEDQFLFGHDILVAPILYEKTFERNVYLPKCCKWKHWETNEVFDGGQTIICKAGIESIPVFYKNDFEIL